MLKQISLHLCLASFLALFWFLLLAYSDQPVVTILVALLASPVLLLALRVCLEGGRPPGLFRPATQSWAFLFGDLALAAAFGVAASGRASVPDDSRFYSVWFTMGCIVVGVLAGVGFHYGMEVKAYAEARHGAALRSPTKLAHDFVSYPLLLGGLVYLGLPALAYQFRWAGALVLAGVVVWVAMAARDAIHPPKPANLHPKWDRQNFSVLE